MAQAAFGQLTSWDDAAVVSKSSGFMNMKDNGDYVVRILDEKPYEFMSHWLEHEGRKTKIKCAGRGCILCAKAGKEDRAKVSYVVNVLNRKTNECAILEFGPQIFEQLKKSVKNPKWGDVRRYDVCINKQKGRAPVYLVQAEPPISPLKDDEVAKVKEWYKTRGNLEQFVAASKNDEIRQKLAEFMGGSSESEAPQSSRGSSSKMAAVEDPVSTEFDFPTYEDSDSESN